MTLITVLNFIKLAQYPNINTVYHIKYDLLLYVKSLKKAI